MKASIVFVALWLVALCPNVSLLLRVAASDSDDTSDDEGLQQPDDQAQVVKDRNDHAALWEHADEEDDSSDNDDDGIYQRNPDYVKPTIDYSVLAKNQTAVQKSVRRVARFFKKHKLKTLACLGLYFLIARHVSFGWLKPHIINTFVSYKTDENGKAIDFKWKTRNILHICVVFGILYHTVKTRNDDDNDGSDSSLLTTLLLGPQHAAASAMLRRLLGGKQHNPAYIPPIRQHYTFENLNDRYLKDVMALAKASKNSLGCLPTTTGTSSSTNNSTIVVLDWTGLDSSVSSLDTLKDCVSFLLSLSNSIDSNSSNTKFDVVVILESPGGSASRYAMAAQQLCRLRKSSHHVTVCVDTVAASGGYMIACTASTIVAAPFALVGSIGVVGQSVNVHKVLENWGVRSMVFRGGRDKAPLGLIGEVTDEQVAKVQDMVDDTHKAFKRHVVENRPILAESIEQIATGDVWFGYNALDNGLIDRIGTSDEYILDRMKEGARVLKLHQVIQKGPFGFPSTIGSLGMDSSRQLFGLRHRIATFVAKALVGADSWKHITSMLAKVDVPLPVRTTHQLP